MKDIFRKISREKFPAISCNPLNIIASQFPLDSNLAQNQFHWIKNTIKCKPISWWSIILRRISTANHVYLFTALFLLTFALHLAAHRLCHLHIILNNTRFSLRMANAYCRQLNQRAAISHCHGTLLYNTFLVYISSKLWKTNALYIVREQRTLFMVLAKSYTKTMPNREEEKQQRLIRFRWSFEHAHLHYLFSALVQMKSQFLFLHS